TNNIRDFRPLHAEALSSAQTHYGIVLIASTKFSWRMSALGKMVTALDQLLRSHGGVDDLGGREIFL
ncbi:MAG TPA: hypothetical protein VMW49_04625, partial [Candidatus Dormibacteraeota bacterium]|nr:hypothetical protein [Candidatus Dormibacteraeota bacterium]